MSPNSTAAAVVLTLLGSFLPSSGFVGAPSTVPRGKVAHLRRNAPVAAPLRSTQAYTSRHRICLATGSAASSASSLLRAAGIADDIDPLEAGPDSATGDVATAVKEDDAEAVTMAALASATEKKEALKPAKKKRKKTDRFMPKGSVAPIMWHEFTELAEGCRGTLCIIHTGLPEDQGVVDSLINQVKERFGNRINIFEEFDEEEDVTEEERRKSKAFEVWLDSVQPVMYHARGETSVDLTQDHIQAILEDLDERLGDEAIIRVNCSPEPDFLIPGLSLQDHLLKFYDL